MVTETSSTPLVVLVADFVNVVGSSSGIEVELTRDADGGLRFYIDGVQAQHPGLTSIAESAMTANELLVGTGTDAYGKTTISDWAKTLIDDADATAARATLSAQQSDSDLDALALVTIAADQLIYGTADSVWAKSTLTAFARTLLDDTTASAARTTLGLGSVATLSSIANSNMASMAANTIKGTIGGGTPSDLTSDEVKQVTGLDRAAWVKDSEAGAPVRTVGTNTTAVFTLADLTVPGSTSTDWSAELEIQGRIYNNSGATNPLRVFTKYGSTTMTNSRDGSRPGNDADMQAFVMKVRLAASGSTSAQHSQIEYWLASASTGGAGYGQYYGNQVEGMAWGVAAETATGALNVKVDAQWDAGSTSSYIEVWSTRLTYYPGS